jgi:nitroreductase
MTKAPDPRRPRAGRLTKGANKGAMMATATTGLSPREIDDVLAAAIRAPSVHNTQPWQFRVASDRIELYADLERRLPHGDPDDRGLWLSCGAVLLNLRLAVEAAGVRPLVTLLPNPTEPALAAVVLFGGHLPVSSTTKKLVAAIPRRASNRKPFTDDPVPSSHRIALIRAAQMEGGWAHVVDSAEERAIIRRLVATAHSEQRADDRYVAEFSRWTGKAQGTTGVPLSAAGPLPEPQDIWTLRDYSDRRGRERQRGKDFESEPLLIVLCSFVDGRPAELTAGVALQRVLLTATDLGLAASMLSAPLELAHTRRDLRQAVGGALVPQTILRIGFGSPTLPTPRRPVGELLRTD